MGTTTYLVTFRIRRYGGEVIRSRHRSKQAAQKALLKYRKACERQPAAIHEIYARIVESNDAGHP